MQIFHAQQQKYNIKLFSICKDVFRETCSYLRARKPSHIWINPSPRRTDGNQWTKKIREFKPGCSVPVLESGSKRKVLKLLATQLQMRLRGGGGRLIEILKICQYSHIWLNTWCLETELPAPPGLGTAPLNESAHDKRSNGVRLMDLGHKLLKKYFQMLFNKLTQCREHDEVLL